MLSIPALLFVIHHDSAGRNTGQVLPLDLRWEQLPKVTWGNELALGSATRALTPKLTYHVSDPGWSWVRARPQKSFRLGQSPRRPAKPTHFQRLGSIPCTSLVGPRITDARLDSSASLQRTQSVWMRARTTHLSEVTSAFPPLFSFFSSLQNYFKTSKLTREHKNIVFINLIK